ncbi:hypothetical protein PC129_g6044 [Phytophthora cactorum]|uniref:Uncharacterized protein n=1 Tax=Phytophthora cactorum TaxID=29920 RepID=A0A329SGE0_9STRA|nr:hypothetical protein Pcac1_g23547 [Phytophthora cactorum]KAG2828847.1 hypothetical protein PC112_g8303 [Phytophthora cactorum]KAG2831703.1 hypothetical protein PC111_g6890 [Phytophthora cactorum]KAG2859822.1 hypothetical protein PC113_g8611 [Phytophthora cactorum]KAG2936722.1 hypothetical protein PC114_g141 [Phytophthora cactorum]
MVLAWFQLVKRSGEPLDLVVDKVVLSERADVSAFRESLKDLKVYNSSNLLKGEHVRDLKVFKDWKTYEDTQLAPLEPWALLVGCGMHGDNPLIVEVPKIWLKLVDANTGAALAEFGSVSISDERDVQSLKIVIKEIPSDNYLVGIGPRNLKVCMNREAYEDPQQAPLKPSVALVGCGVTEELALIVVVPQRVKVPTFSERSAKPLVSTIGLQCDFQKPSNLDAMTQAIPAHFDAWEKKYRDKRCHPLFLYAGGPGTDKSRILDEFPSLIKDSLKNHEDKEMVEMLESAYTFDVTFEECPPDGGTFYETKPVDRNTNAVSAAGLAHVGFIL